MQLNKLRLALAAPLAATLILGIAPSAHAQWTLGQWNLGANGHFYAVEAITGPSDGWLIARSQAQALVAPNGASVDLATITSASEDTFVFNGINDPAYWILDPANNNEGPNLGGLQFDKLSEPNGHWGWVTGEAWSYTNWSAGSPNNQGGTEDYLTYFNLGGNGRSDSWNDISSSTSPSGTGIHYYVAETTTIGSASAPEPGTLAFLALGGTLVLARRRRQQG
jgi:hypothetical protein